MFDQLVIRVKTREFRLYSQTFSFFHSNSINKILSFKKIDQVILFRDLQFFDNQTEYLKRAYYESQAYTRIKKLINYYEKNMTPPSPSLLTLEQYQYLDSRNRKILKLCIMKQKSQAQGQKQRKKSFVQSNGLKGSNTSGIDILPKLDETNLQNLADSERYQSQQESYDSDVHNVFSDFKEKAKNLYASVNDLQSDYRQLLFLRNIKESQLIINFKIANEPQSDFNNCENEPIINVSEVSRTFSGSPLKFNKASKQSQYPAQNQPLNFKTQYKNQPLQQHQNFNPQQQNFNNFQSNNQQAIQSCFQSGSFGISYQQQPITQNNILPLKILTGSDTIQNSNKNNSIRFVQNNVLPQQVIGQMPKNVRSLDGLPLINYNQNVPLVTHTQMNFSHHKNASSSGNKNFNSDSMSGNVNQSNNHASKNGSQSSNKKTSTALNNAVSPPKKGKLSFMEYYHSVPVKNPTNILEKYIKRKK